MGLTGVARAGLLIAAAALAVSADPAGAALPDASCPGPPASGLSVTTDQRYAQTFTALHTGVVVRAQVEINKAGTGDFLIQILATNGTGVPLNGPLGSATISDASVASGPTTLDGTFSSPAPVIAGRRYGLMVTRPGGSGFTIRDRPGDPCAGQEYLSGNQTNAFTPLDPAFDFVFQLFIDPPNEFTIGLQRRRSLTVTVPGPGEISLVQGVTAGPPAIESKTKKLLKSSRLSAAAAGDVVVPLRLTKSGKALLKLKQKHRFKVGATITFTPTGGEPATQSQTLKIK